MSHVRSERDASSLNPHLSFTYHHRYTNTHTNTQTNIQTGTHTGIHASTLYDRKLTRSNSATVLTVAYFGTRQF
jgi:hypothetical protein